MKYVILSTTVDEEYSFFAPITARIFREVTKYKPFVVLEGSADSWKRPQDRLMLDELSKWSVHTYYLGGPFSCSKALAIKLSRWFISSLEYFTADDYLLTSDVDLWPISFAWYNNQNPSKNFHLFNADIHGYKMHSTCHIGARTENWRRLMSIKAGIRPADLIEDRVRYEFAVHPANWIGRRSDEQFMKDRILSFPTYSGTDCEFEFIERGTPPRGRVDRESWPGKVETGGKIDAHLLRPGTDPRVWNRIKGVIPDSMREWAEDYRSRYVEARNR